MTGFWIPKGWMDTMSAPQRGHAGPSHPTFAFSLLRLFFFLIFTLARSWLPFRSQLKCHLHRKTFPAHLSEAPAITWYIIPFFIFNFLPCQLSEMIHLLLFGSWDVSSMKARTNSVSSTNESPVPRLRPDTKEEVQHTFVQQVNNKAHKRPFHGGCTWQPVWVGTCNGSAGSQLRSN